MNLPISTRNHKGYLRIEESLITKFVLPLIVSFNDVTVFVSLNMRNLRYNVLIASNMDSSVFPIVHMLHSLLWFENLMVIFGYVSIAQH